MNETKDRHPALLGLLIFLVVFWLFAVSFRVLLLAPVTSFLASNTVNDSLSPLATHAQLVDVAEKGRAFVVGERNVELPTGDDERTAFTPEVVSHMEDVRYVLQGVEIATMILTVFLLVVGVLVRRRAGRTTLGSGLFAGGIVAIVVALLLTVFGFVSFDTLFSGMHGIFFADGTWTFAEDSLLICAYPLSFWIGMGIIWALVLVFASTLVSTAGFLLRRSSKL
jgi:integral membrane protein (TIGR01906 family)